MRVLSFAPFLWALLGLAGSVHADALSADHQASLRSLLYQDCGSCHGMTLKGGLGPALTRQRMNAYDRNALAGLILSGIPDTPMPPWATLLNDDEALWLADELQRNAPDATAPDTTTTDTTTTADTTTPDRRQRP
ncbi:c-type cytochrome [Halomonas sp. V046]|uniref:c-type cytochrome n=1 Tax=Halomonas sp. V046 TaxID=3459611 RepID=UPI00404503DD